MLLTAAISLILYHTVSATIITTNITNGSYGIGEYYYLSATGHVVCSPASDCIVDCVDDCPNTLINASAADTLTLLNSNGFNNLFVYGPKLQVNVYGWGYTGTVFHFNDTKVVNYEGSGYPITLYANDAEEVYINPSGWISTRQSSRSSFYLENVSKTIQITEGGTSKIWGSYIYASNANELEINCMSTSSGCYGIDIWPPHQYEYQFKVYCSSIKGVCQNIFVHTPNSYANNYMELVCSRQYSRIANSAVNDDWDDMCNIQWQCDNNDGNVSVSITEYVLTSARYECNSTACCPWTDADDMILNASRYYRKEEESSISPLKTYYNFNEFPDWADYGPYQKITCEAGSTCTIQCKKTRSCKGYTIYAGLTDNLVIDCIYGQACEQMYIAEPPKVSATINCVVDEDLPIGSVATWYLCSDSVFDLTLVPNIHIVCYNRNVDGTASISTDKVKGSCYGLQLLGDGSNDVTVECLDKLNCYESRLHLTNVESQVNIIPGGTDPLQEVTVYAEGTNKLNINCSFDGACNRLDVYPPYHDEYVFTLSCPLIDVNGGCWNVDIYVPNSTTFVTNYMELICSDYGREATCLIDFICLDIGTYRSTYVKWENDDYWFCREDWADDCCPWISPQDMIEPVPSAAPTLGPTTKAPASSPDATEPTPDQGLISTSDGNSSIDPQLTDSPVGNGIKRNFPLMPPVVIILITLIVCPG